MNYRSVCIEAIGRALPPVVVTSLELEGWLKPLYERLGLVEGRLELMTGIAQRRLWQEGTLPSQGAVLAAQDALHRAGLEPGDVDALINCSVSRDFVEPATSTAVHRALGLPPRTLNFDISNACLGMATGILMLANMVELGQIETGLAVSGENSGPLLRHTVECLNKDTSLTRQSLKKHFASLTIGSCGVAVVVTSLARSRAGHRLLGAASITDSSANELCQGNARGGMTDGSAPVMATDSQELLKRGIQAAQGMWNAFKNTTGWNEDTPDVICTHQVGKAHSSLLFDTLGLDKSKDYTTFQTLGNCGSASWPVTCSFAEEHGVLASGSKLAVLAIGSGINCTGLAIQW